MKPIRILICVVLALLSVATSLSTTPPTFHELKAFGTPSPGSNPLSELLQATDGAFYGTAYQGGSNGYGTVFKLNSDGTGFTVLKNFDSTVTGSAPQAGLTQGTDGALYGTTRLGGSAGYGTVFKLNLDGTGFTVLKNFDSSTAGGYPQGKLIQGTGGALYGTARIGGSGGYGTVFKMNTDGTGFAVLKNFDSSTSGAYPQAGLIQGPDGAFYGTASSGGSAGSGTVFKLSADGTGFIVLKNFDSVTTGGNLSGRVLRAMDGSLYGTTSSGGTLGYGTIFKMHTDGTAFSVLKNFDSATTGANIRSGLLQAVDGSLYGAAVQGGATGSGTVFKLQTDASGFTVLVNSNAASTGASFYAEVVQGTDGALYSTAYQGSSSGGGALFKLNTDGTGFTILKNLFFPADVSADGGYVYGQLLQAGDGMLYGTTSQGGSSGYGTLFKMNLDGTGFTVLRSFDSAMTGANLHGRLMQGIDGAIYGTAAQGGASGFGTIYKLNTDGSGFTVLKNFDSSTTGGYVYAGLVQGSDGSLYGTTYSGGSLGYGTVFKLRPDGTGFTILKNLDSLTTGAYLYAGLLLGTDGALYGATYNGGAAGYGTVFKLNTDGSGFTVLKNFDSITTGGLLYGGLIQGSDGTLYGTASQGGAGGLGSGGYGTVFKLNTDGTGFAVIENFDSFTTGASILSGVMQGNDGALYGTAAQGGSNGYGTAFRLNTDGTGFTILLNFDSPATGAVPRSGLMQATDLNFYGTTSTGGNAAGTLFRLLRLPPTVVTLAATGIFPPLATLNGTANPLFLSTLAHFEYSSDPGLAGAIATPNQNIGANGASVPFSASLTGLAPKTTYYFRAVASNAVGTVYGAILSFTTSGLNWGNAGADPTTGNLDPTLIPTTGTQTFTNVNGQGYNLVVTTCGLNSGGAASYFGANGWWFEGGGPSYGYGTVTFRFYDSVTGNPFPITGVDFRLLDAEIGERFRSFGYWDANSNFVSVPYGTGRLTFSNGPIYHATDGSYENNAPQESGDQLGKWIEFNVYDLSITGFTFQAHRQTASAGSVIMGSMISPFALWRTANFSPIPYPAAADDMANPDNDASINVFEYFYGTDPNVADHPDPLQMTVIASKAALTFPRSIAATDTTATVEGADSASGPWTALAQSKNGVPFVALVAGVDVTETGAGAIRTVQVRDEYLITDPAHPMRFLRLRVVH